MRTRKFIVCLWKSPNFLILWLTRPLNFLSLLKNQFLKPKETPPFCFKGLAPVEWLALPKCVINHSAPGYLEGGERVEVFRTQRRRALDLLESLSTNDDFAACSPSWRQILVSTQVYSTPSSFISHSALSYCALANKISFFFFRLLKEFVNLSVCAALYWKKNDCVEGSLKQTFMKTHWILRQSYAWVSKRFCTKMISSLRAVLHAHFEVPSCIISEGLCCPNALFLGGLRVCRLWDFAFIV